MKVLVFDVRSFISDDRLCVCMCVCVCVCVCVSSGIFPTTGLAVSLLICFLTLAVSPNCESQCLYIFIKHRELLITNNSCSSCVLMLWVLNCGIGLCVTSVCLSGICLGISFPRCRRVCSHTSRLSERCKISALFSAV